MASGGRHGREDQHLSFLFLPLSHCSLKKPSKFQRLAVPSPFPLPVRELTLGQQAAEAPRKTSRELEAHHTAASTSTYAHALTWTVSTLSRVPTHFCNSAHCTLSHPNLLSSSFREWGGRGVKLAATRSILNCARRSLKRRGGSGDASRIQPPCRQAVTARGNVSNRRGGVLFADDGHGVRHLEWGQPTLVLAPVLHHPLDSHINVWTLDWRRGKRVLPHVTSQADGAGAAASRTTEVVNNATAARIAGSRLRAPSRRTPRD
ncbi:hypothetical protein PR202_ga05492 [Eleusine coracana subsp. coracana]|uniref:Uncharacterized protein n=1 Tax=Eleusine coracana subsp. coracana TaxID=191504 RepID=A0AAV5BUR9_ELECO|nr:hypothetical protein PR202_ga05039 [Eleusine coracana subsp. coracana]GJM89313.1 hypothetical protein PR202_ga05492 [Eleusine coracana subsp. coracana]